MKNEPYWVDAAREPLPPIRESTGADAVVVGGGIAGLTVAQLLADRGLDVVLLEQSLCGYGATGRSSGFITPDSELQVEQLARRFGDDDAALLWRAAASACDQLRLTIEAEDLSCDALPADSLYIGTGRSGRSSVESEHQSRKRLGLESHLLSGTKLDAALTSSGFEAAVRYGGTFAMTPHRFALALRDRLRARGVRIFERSPVTSQTSSEVMANGATVRARSIFFCADLALARLAGARPAAYHAQTFVAATAPLAPERFAELFPSGDLLVWDTDLVYQYFRRTADDRFLIGGGLLRKTYAPPSSPAVIVRPLSEYMRRHLPTLADVEFEHVWSGLIGVTKDFLPVAGRDGREANWFYAGCGSGIPWSVLAARCAVESAIDGASELERFFHPQRAFTDLDIVQPVLRKPLTFALAHGYAKGVLRGSAEAVRRRRPFVVTALAIALLGAAHTVWRRLRR